MTDWKLTLGDDAVWSMVPSRPDLAEEALLWLTNTIMDVDRQLTHAKADVADAGRMSKAEWAEHQSWRAQAVSFKRLCERRKRELTSALKAARIDTRDHEADGRWKWEHKVVSHDITPKEAFILGVVAGRTS